MPYNDSFDNMLREKEERRKEYTKKAFVFLRE
jgi:hypothetical protein